MTSWSPGRWVGVGSAGVGLLLLVAFLVIPPPPHPAVLGPEASAWWLSRVDEEQRFGHHLIYGEFCGGLGAADIRVRGEALPEEMQGAFYDGVGHGLQRGDWSLDELQMAAPEHHRGWLIDGRFRALAEDLGGDPDRVLPAVQGLQQEMPGIAATNGVRIGLQRSLGHDMTRALETAGRYPQDWWPALFEELGWRTGNDELDPGVLVASVPGPARCAFLHGVVRGGVLARLEEPAVGAQLVNGVGALEPGCLAAAWQGYGTGLYLGLGHDPEGLARVVDGLPGDVRSALSGPLKAAQTTQDRGGIWVLLESD